MRLALALAALALVAGCGGNDGGSAPTVFAAASLTDVFEAIDPDAQFSFAGSDELATQIREGAPADSTRPPAPAIRTSSSRKA